MDSERGPPSARPSRRPETLEKRRKASRIELWRKVLATDYSGTCCAICGNDFDRGTVFPVASGAHGEELGEICLVCLDYLNRRKEDADDPTLGNWPARDRPSLEDLEEARRRYPEAMFPDSDAYDAAAPDPDVEDDVLQSSFIWQMEREVEPRPLPRKK